MRWHWHGRWFIQAVSSPSSVHKTLRAFGKAWMLSVSVSLVQSGTRFWLRHKGTHCRRRNAVLKEFHWMSKDRLRYLVSIVSGSDGSEARNFFAGQPQGAEWRRLLLHHGAIYFEDVNQTADFERLLDDVGFPRMPYVGGAAPRTAVTSRVLTSNESSVGADSISSRDGSSSQPTSVYFLYCDLPPGRAVKPPVYTRTRCTNVS